jgi:hypothetical protein
MPRSRGGSNEEANIVWTDLECNMMKGNLTAEEFIELLAFLKDRAVMAKIVKMRLKAGGFIYRG